MVVQIVRFRTALSDAEVIERYRSRAEHYRSLAGLLQKHYLKYDTGERGAVYIWDSIESLKKFRQSDLAKGIVEAYQIQDAADVRTAEVVLTLRPQPGGGI